VKRRAVQRNAEFSGYFAGGYVAVLRAAQSPMVCVRWVGHAGTPARVREVRWRVWGLVMQHCGYCSWGYMARLGGPPREALYTVALRSWTVGESIFSHESSGWGWWCAVPALPWPSWPSSLRCRAWRGR
jgi:hypothetical protein